MQCYLFANTNAHPEMCEDNPHADDLLQCSNGHIYRGPEEKDWYAPLIINILNTYAMNAKQSVLPLFSRQDSLGSISLLMKRILSNMLSLLLLGRKKISDRRRRRVGEGKTSHGLFLFHTLSQFNC